MRLEFKHLILIDAIHKYGSLTLAAKQLHLTQPALSHSIKQLEDYYNIELFIKQGKRLQPTQAGHYLQQRAKQLLPSIYDVEAGLKMYAQGLAGKLRIGVACHPCYEWLLSLMDAYLEKSPNFDVDIIQSMQHGSTASLLHYEVDCLVTPDPIKHEAITFKAMFNYRQVLAMHVKHPLYIKAMQTNKMYVMPEDLQTETLLTYPVATERLDIFNQFLQPANCQPYLHKTIETTDLMLALVKHKPYVAALPNWLIDKRHSIQAYNDIVYLELSAQSLHKSIYLGYRTQEKNLITLANLLDLA